MPSLSVLLPWHGIDGQDERQGPKSPPSAEVCVNSGHSYPSYPRWVHSPGTGGLTVFGQGDCGGANGNSAGLRVLIASAYSLYLPHGECGHPRQGSVCCVLHAFVLTAVPECVDLRLLALQMETTWVCTALQSAVLSGWMCACSSLSTQLIWLPILPEAEHTAE